MVKLRVLVATAGVVIIAGCQDYESPGAVADESVWSHVPAESSQAPQEPEAETRQRALTELEERLDDLQDRLGRVESAFSAQPRAASEGARELAQARSELRSAAEELREMSDLTENEEAFRQRRQNVTAKLDDVETRLRELTEIQEG